MIFSTFWFFAAAIIFLPLFWLARTPKLRLTLLIIFCAVFHTHFAGPAGVAPIVVLGTITYCIGLSRNKRLCQIGIAICVFALCFYKYTHFLCADLLQLFIPTLGVNAKASVSLWLPSAPPLAISFFTFEFVHYLFEVSKGSEPIRKLPQFIQFAFYFPSLVAGPIKRYAQFLPALESGLNNVSTRDIAEGILLVSVGFFKKTLLADNLIAFIDAHTPSYGIYPCVLRWVLLLAIALRIYMDFSGYTDMAIGFSRLLGIALPKNFNWPYLATSIQDFWQRWHMSLSTWIRDYVYIPLGGNRVGTVRKVANGLLAFALCGLWHGASWNFLVWGLYHGVGLAIQSTYRKRLGPVGEMLAKGFERAPIVGWAFTATFVAVGWLLFFYPVSEAVRMTGLLFSV